MYGRMIRDIFISATLYNKMSQRINCHTFYVSVLRAGFYLIPLLMVSNQIADLFLSDWKSMESDLPPKSSVPESNYRNHNHLFQNANLVAGNEPWFYPDSGCTMYKYTHQEAKLCMKESALKNGRNHFIFAGDSKTRILYDAFNYFMGETPIALYRHFDERYNDTSNNMEYYAEFLWVPYLFEGVSLFANIRERIRREKPKFVVHQAALWDIKDWNKDPFCYTLFKGNLTLLVPSIKLITEKVPYLWMALDPVRYDLLDKTRHMLTNEIIIQYNNLIAKMLKGSNGTMWYSSRQVAQALNKNGYEDGMHLKNSSARYKAQILLNWHCNKYNVHNSSKALCFVADNQATSTTALTDFKNTFNSQPKLADYKGSFSSQRSNLWRVISVVIGFLVVFAVSLITPWMEKGGNILSWLVSVCKIILIMGYINMCQMKAIHCDNPYDGRVVLAVLVVFFVIVTLVCIEKTCDHQMLNRRQTDEWKGLLSFIFIITLMAQDNPPEPDSPLMCLIVTSYLFIMGFGHFTYFWTTGDFSFRRVFKTLVRLNFAVIVVCLVTHINAPYMVRRMIPLVTVWFLVIYTTMASWPWHTITDEKSSEKRRFIIMTVKLFMLFIVTTLVSYIQSYLLGIMGLTIPEGREYDFALQKYSVLSGMAFGLLNQYYQGELPNKLDSFPTNALKFKTIHMVVMCIPGLLVGPMLISRNIVSGPWRLIYPNISFMLVISYAVIRNLTVGFRTKYNYVFAWFGQISLELYVAFYHIWMARCNGYIIEVVPGYTTFNMTTTTIIFISVCFYLRETTQSITSLLEWKS